MNSKPFLFLDRDGTLIEDVGYPKDPAIVRLLPGAADALRALEAFGFQLAVVSNQSGVGRGWITPQQAKAVDQQFVELVRQQAKLDVACWYCFHAPEVGCLCRKPKPGLLRQAACELGGTIDIRAVMVGDKPSDVAAGQAAGCGLNLLFRGDWSNLLDVILQHQRSLLTTPATITMTTI